MGTIADSASKGGKARAAALTPEARSDSARRAVQARWAKRLQVSISGYLPEKAPNITYVITQNLGQSNAPSGEIWTTETHFVGATYGAMYP